MDPAELSELLHRRDLDELNAFGAALLDERFAEDGVGIGGRLGVLHSPCHHAVSTVLYTHHLTTVCRSCCQQGA